MTKIADDLYERVSALEARLAAAERRLPPEPIAAPKMVEDEGVRLHYPGRTLSPPPPRDELARLLAATRDAVPALRAQENRGGRSIEAFDRKLLEDFATCYNSLMHCERLAVGVDQNAGTSTWIDRMDNWRLDNGHGTSSVTAFSFIYAALALGIEVRLAHYLPETQFGILRFPGGRAS